MKSIIAHLGTQDFPRIRVGIAPREGRAEALAKRLDAVKYVLSDFATEEKPIIRKVYQEVADAIHCLITDGVAAAMNKYN